MAISHLVIQKSLGSDRDKPKGSGGANDSMTCLLSPPDWGLPGVRDCLAHVDNPVIMGHQGWPRAGAHLGEWWAVTQPTIPFGQTRAH